jgi:uncharacterized protein (DUF2267 family)
VPMPLEYRRASELFLEFLVDARDAAGLASTHQTYTMVQGVLQTFRRRLDLRDAILFAGVLPPLLRAIFVADWNTEEPQRQFTDRALMTKEVQALRAEHNFAPDNAIRVVAGSLRTHMDEKRLDQVLSRLPAGAIEFWQP